MKKVLNVEYRVFPVMQKVSCPPIAVQSRIAFQPP
jgi:hypothetical protein